MQSTMKSRARTKAQPKPGRWSGHQGGDAPIPMMPTTKAHAMLQERKWADFTKRIGVLVDEARTEGESGFLRFNGVGSMLDALVRVMRAISSHDAAGLETDVEWYDGEFEFRDGGQRLAVVLRGRENEYTVEERKKIEACAEARDLRRTRERRARLADDVARAEREGTPEQYVKGWRLARAIARATDDERAGYKAFRKANERRVELEKARKELDDEKARAKGKAA